VFSLVTTWLISVRKRSMTAFPCRSRPARAPVGAPISVSAMSTRRRASCSMRATEAPLTPESGTRASR
jgi:hypothetical protein